MRKYLILTCVCLLFVFDLKAQVEITSAGTSAAYTLNVPGVFPLRNGVQVTFKAHTTCSASPTMNVSGTGALPIRKEGASLALSANDIKTGQIVTLAYDGTFWQMLSQLGTSAAPPSTYWDPNGTDIHNNNVGNVGIGIISPGVVGGSTKYLSAASTESYSTAPMSLELIGSNPSTLDPVTKMDFIHVSDGPTYDHIGSIQTFRGGDVKDGHLGFFTADAGSLGERMRIDNKGNVGIGTTTPATNLQLYGTGTTNMSIVSGSTQKSRVYFGSTAFAYLGAVEYDNSSNSMNFWTNNTPNRIYIDNGGKVGIGNSAPTSTLHVTGNARITGLVGPGTVIADASGNLSLAAGTTITGSGTNNYLARWTPSSSQLGIGATYDDGTNVGIGTSTPGKLAGANRYLTIAGTDVGTNNTTGSLEIVGNIGATNTMASKVDFLGLDFSNVAVPRARIEARSGNGATLAGQMLFYVNSNGSAANLIERMRIRESGEVGIGNVGVVGSLLSIGASNQFQVSSTGNLSRINNVSYTWPAANASGFLSNDGAGTLSWSTAGVLAGGIANKVTYWTGTNSVSANNFFSWDNTNVRLGVGVASPLTTLHIASAGVSAIGIQSTDAITVAGTNISRLNFTDGQAPSSGQASILAVRDAVSGGVGDTPTALTFITTADGTSSPTERMRIANSGNVGIGTTTPDATFNVEGSWDIGTANIVTGIQSGAIGSSNTVSGNRALSLGNFTSAPSLGAMVLGDWSGGGPTVLTSTVSDQFSSRFAGGYRFFTNSTLTATQGIYFAAGGNVGLGVAAPLNKLDVEGGTVIGATYSGTNTAPTNGLLVEGRVGIGTATPTHQLTVSSNTGGATLQSIKSYAASTFANSLAFQKGRGTEAAPSAVLSGDDLGYIDFYGYNSGNASMQLGATVSATAAQGFSTANAAGSNLVFSTAPLNTAGVVERMTVYYNGNVGVGTTAAPLSKFKVEGDIEIPAANDYLYSTAKTNYSSISPVAFIPESAVFARNSVSGYVHLSGGTYGTVGEIHAPVNLPNGATITEVRFYIYDQDATYDFTYLQIFAGTMSSGGTTFSSATIPTGTYALTSVAVNPNWIVNNSTTQYMIRVGMAQNTSAHRLYGVRITYTVTKAD